MKRFVTLLFASSVVVISALAQSPDERYTQLELSVNQVQGRVDSLNSLIKSARLRYANHPEAREQIARQITAMEMEAVTLKREYDKVLTEFTDYQQYIYAHTVNTESNLEQVVAEDTASVVINYTPRANLVDNGVFEASMSAADLKMLKAAQRDERTVVAKIKEYMRSYDRMVSLQLEYERVDTQEAADSVLNLLDSVRGVAAKVEDAIYDKWHNVFDNKVYAYNLMMEKEGHLNLLTAAEDSLSKAMSESEQSVDNCESSVLCEYFYRKQALLGYESRVSEVLKLSMAKDSLNKVQKSIIKGDYCLPRVNIVRRSFIAHEPLKVIKPTIYTPKNPIPHTHIYDYGTVYRIRIGIFTNRPNLSALRGITPLSYTDKYHNGKYAYFVGGFLTEEDALEGVAYLKKLGFKAPQPVMWVDGEYISNIEEWKRKNIGFNIEITGVTTLSDEVKAHISIRNEKCQFSRIGTTFIVGTFASQSDAELVASEIVAMDSGIKAEVKSVK